MKGSATVVLRARVTGCLCGYSSAWLVPYEGRKTDPVQECIAALSSHRDARYGHAFARVEIEEVSAPVAR